MWQPVCAACGVNALEFFQQQGFIPLRVASLRNLSEFHRITEKPVHCSSDCPRGFEDAERGVDLWTRGSEQLGELVLRKFQLKRNALPGQRLPITQSDEQESCEALLERMERDRFQLLARVSEALA